MSHLERIVGATREEVERRRAATPEAQLEEAARARTDVRDFRGALSGPGLSLIAEHKRRSPSAGAIRDGAAVSEVVRAYENGGATALSILTEGPSFGGSLEDLREARAASTLPLLRKDFTVDSYQLHEALAAGADAVLLIVAAVSEAELRSLHERSTELGLAALVEVHDDRELEIAVNLGAQLVGINNRDLGTLEVDTGRAIALIKQLPDGVTVVAESGFSQPGQLQELAAAGFDAVLMGEALMRAPDIEAACRALTAPTM